MPDESRPFQFRPKSHRGRSLHGAISWSHGVLVISSRICAEYHHRLSAFRFPGRFDVDGYDGFREDLAQRHLNAVGDLVGVLDDHLAVHD